MNESFMTIAILIAAVVGLVLVGLIAPELATIPIFML